MITAKEFIKNNSPCSMDGFMIEFAKLHVEAALKAAEQIAIEFDSEGNYDNSILNAYPPENIK